MSSSVTIGGTTYTLPYADLLPALAGAERDRLRDDIQRRGVQYPVVIDEHNSILDGYNRATIAAELGLTSIPVRVVTGLSEDEKRALAEDLNVHRRHLTRAQVRAVIERRLKKDPAVSDRKLAGELGVDNKTVGSVRSRLETTAEIPQLTPRKGKDNKVRRRSAPRKTKNVSVPEAADKRPPTGKGAGKGGPFGGWVKCLNNYRCNARMAAVELGRLAKIKVTDRNAERLREITQRFRDIADGIERWLLGDQARPGVGNHPWIGGPGG